MNESDVTQPKRKVVFGKPIKVTPPIDPAIQKEKALSVLREQLCSARTEARRIKLRARIEKWKATDVPEKAPALTNREAVQDIIHS